MDDYVKYLKKIWSAGWITNHGPLVSELEKKLKNYFGVKYLFFVSNGTVALEIALKALNITGEVITTPFSYVATTSSIAWMNCTPVFADIDPGTLCVNTDQIKKAITKRTQAILATHVYGNPCDVKEIEHIAKKNKLKVIYDSSHCFGVNYKGKSILKYGDLSTLSFHATKLFHTAEGGAVVTDNDELAHRISYMRNFGHKGQEDFWGLGINGKNSELHAALGLSVLPKIRMIINQRKKVSGYYDKFLAGSGLRRPETSDNVDYNYSYYPVIFNSEKQLLKVRKALNKQNIFPRRYFYPSLNKLSYVNKSSFPVTEDISQKILCLPLYYALDKEDVKRITGTIRLNL